MRGIGRHGYTRPNADLKHLRARFDLKAPNDIENTLGEHARNNLVVEVGELGVEFALVGVFQYDFFVFVNHYTLPNQDSLMRKQHSPCLMAGTCLSYHWPIAVAIYAQR